MTMAGRDFADPVGVLCDCHRRIETSLAALRGLSESANGAQLTGEDRESFDAALRDLRETVLQHTADEEESLFPRLRRHKDSRLLPVLARIESLEEEHVCCDRIQAEVETIGQAWLKWGTLRPPDGSRLSTLVAQLCDVYRHHIAVEENEVFPATATAFSESTLQAIGGEMAHRRGSPK